MGWLHTSQKATNLREWLRKSREWTVEKGKSQWFLLSRMRDKLKEKKIFSFSKQKDMLLGQLDVPNNEFYVGLTYFGYWEYLMDWLDDEQMIKKEHRIVTFIDPCENTAQYDKKDDGGIPMPLWQVGGLGRWEIVDDDGRERHMGVKSTT